ncbi:MAG: formylglycine-generating enzyme family protein, partial [Archangium sp.]
MTPLLLMWLVTAVPCEKAPPPGMVCIEGGNALVGADAHTLAEQPQHSVYVETFYLDAKEVTVGDYSRCERVGACPRLPRPSFYARFQRPELPAVPTNWDMAHQYCVFAGKRLPSEAEWEKAARGPEGRTSRGPCDGARPCKGYTQRVLEGGSWYWPEDMLRGTWRRGQSPSSGLHRLSFRCASSTPWLSAWPPRFMSKPPARPADPALPSQEELEKAHAVVEDTDVFQIPVCGRKGKA